MKKIIKAITDTSLILISKLHHKPPAKQEDKKVVIHNLYVKSIGFKPIDETKDVNKDLTK